MLLALLDFLMLLGIIPSKKEADGSQLHTAMRRIGIGIVFVIALTILCCLIYSFV